MSKRKEATAFILKYLDKLAPGNDNVGIWKERLESLNDKEFEGFMTDLRDGKVCLNYTVPNLDKKNQLNTKRNLGIAKELGHQFFQRLILTEPNTGVVYRTQYKYLVTDQVMRRQIQTLSKKSSIPDNNKSIEQTTGQPSGESRSSSLSFPEIQILISQGWNDSIVELVKVRGGDTKAFNSSNKSIIEKGSFDINVLEDSDTGATETLKNILTGMHIKNSL